MALMARVLGQRGATPRAEAHRPDARPRSARRCSTATARSRRPSRCCPPSRGSRSPRRHSSLRRFRSPSRSWSGCSPCRSTARPRSAPRSDRSSCSGSGARAAGRRRHRAAIPKCCARFGPGTRSRFWSRIRGSASSRWARCSWWSPGPRRSTPTSVISAAGPIRIAWFALVLPALVVNYFGQGALLLADPEAVRNPFYLLAPAWALLPAGRARDRRHGDRVAGGDHRRLLDHQPGDPAGLCAADDGAAHLGPAMGQIYVPAINAALLVAVLELVLTFRSSSGLAAAYGIAVSGTMLVTTLFAYLVARSEWRWPRALALAVFGGCSPWTSCSSPPTRSRSGRRLVPADVRRGRAAAADHVEARTRIACATPRRRHAAARRLSSCGSKRNRRSRCR